MGLKFRVGVAAVVALCAIAPAAVAKSQADLVVTGGRIYTAAPGGLAEAFAVSGGRLVYVGSAAAVRQFVGPKTRVRNLGGAFVLPGLVDAHLHPIDTVDLKVCDLDSKVVSLRQLSAFARECLRKYPVEPGQRLLVHQWNYASGNQPDREYPTLRAALDKASTTRQIQLLGNDAHHSAFNSLALSTARNTAGAVVGISKATLATDFAAYSRIIGVDASGEPNGAVNEDARYTINPRSMVYPELDRVLKDPAAIPRRMNRVGITAMTDAMADPAGYEVWDTLQRSGQPVFGVAYKDKPDATAGFLRQHGNPYVRVGRDTAGSVAIDFGLYGVPESYLIDTAGIVRWRFAGALTTEIVQQELTPLLKTLA